MYRPCDNLRSHYLRKLLEEYNAYIWRGDLLGGPPTSSLSSHLDFVETAIDMANDDVSAQACQLHDAAFLGNKEPLYQQALRDPTFQISEERRVRLIEMIFHCDFSHLDRMIEAKNRIPATVDRTIQVVMDELERNQNAFAIPTFHNRILLIELALRFYQKVEVEERKMEFERQRRRRASKRREKLEPLIDSGLTPKTKVLNSIIRENGIEVTRIKKTHLSNLINMGKTLDCLVCRLGPGILLCLPVHSIYPPDFKLSLSSIGNKSLQKSLEPNE